MASEKLYSVLEQHLDGSWWYHLGWTFETREAAEQKIREGLWFDPQRPMRLFEHHRPFPQDHGRYTRDLKTFGIAGYIDWTDE